MVLNYTTNKYINTITVLLVMCIYVRYIIHIEFKFTFNIFDLSNKDYRSIKEPDDFFEYPD